MLMIPPTKCMVRSHIDFLEHSSINRFGLFLPVKFDLTQSDLTLSRRKNVIQQYSIESVGTRIIDLARTNSHFSFNDASLLHRSCWLVDSPCFTLRHSYSNYSAIVVNKIPHGGGKQLAFSQRITLFFYIVPIDWADSDIFELEVTIPAVHFLLPRSVVDDEFVDLKTLVNDNDIKAWLDLIPNVPEHLAGPIDRQTKLLKNQRDVYKALVNMPK